ncbi:MAG: hypothetical protein GY755_08225 [Chloroflexi bacterium]|nr:hypothetical protein [Chloroflexota bacterium]
MNKIIDDTVTNGKSYYLIQWKDTITTNIETYKCYKNDIKKITKLRKKFIIEWKNTWMKFENIKDTCDEILGAYLLLKLHHFGTK